MQKITPKKNIQTLLFVQKVVLLISVLYGMMMFGTVTYAAQGDVTLTPSTQSAGLSQDIDVEFRVDAGAQVLGAYQFLVDFDPLELTVDTTKGTNGITPGTAGGGFAHLSDALTTGEFEINGINAGGVTGTDLHIVTMHFTTSASFTGPANIAIRPDDGNGVNGEEIILASELGVPFPAITITGDADVTLTVSAATPTIHYPLNDGTGTTANDTQGSNNGTLFNTPTWNNTTQKLGSHALDFDGGNTANDYVEVAHSADLSQSEFSASTWFRLDQLPSTAGSNATIARKRRSVAPFYIWDLSVISATDKLLFRVHDGTSTYTAESDSAIVAGTWYHTVARLDASGNATLHIDAAQQAIADTGASVTTANPDALRIGAGGATANGLDGTIDDMCYFNSTLSAGEITALYNGGAGVECGVDTTAPTLTQTTPVTTPTNDTTPEYTFTTDEAGTITYGGSCSAATTTATVGANTLSFNTLANGTYSDCTITVTDAASNASTALAVTAFTIDTSLDTTAPTLTQTTPVTTPTNDTTPEYTFTTDEAGTITYGGSCSAATTTATVGANTLSFNTLANGTYSDCTITVTDAASNTSTALAVTAFTIDTSLDTTAPTLTQTTPVTTPTNDTTPEYTFTTDEAGTITYGGSCSAATTTATVGANTLSFNTLANGTYSDCTITVTDAASNASTALAVTAFTIDTSLDTTAPTLTQTTPVTTPTNDTTPEYTFTTDEAGTITYGGSCSAATTTATVGANTLSFNTLANGTYSDCTITVTDAASNASTALAVTAFTIDTTDPVITITAPTKTSITSITDTTVQVTDNTGITTTSVTVDGATTATTSSFACVQTNTTTVDCTLSIDESGNLTIAASDDAGNATTKAETGYTVTGDITAPTLTQTTPVTTPTNDTTPEYTFTTDEAGTITYGGSCSAATTTATVGANTLSFNTLANGTYSDCTITVTDAASNASTALAVTAFTIDTSLDTTAPTLTQTTPVTTPTNDTTPEYTFTTDEAGTITYGGSCSAATTTATVGANTLSFNTLANGTYSDCTITVTDAASNASTALAVTAFTIGIPTPDTKNPQVVSVTRGGANEEIQKDDTVTFTVTFDEDVQNVDETDFAIFGAATVNITNTTATSASVYVVTVNSVSGADGDTIGLTLDAISDIIDIAGNPITPVTDTSNFETYIIRDAPLVTTSTDPITDFDIDLEDGDDNDSSGKQELDDDEKAYADTRRVKFKGKVDPSYAGYTIKIFADGDEEGEGIVGKDGKWSDRITFDDDETYDVEFKYYDKDGKLVAESDTFEVKVDTDSPEFTDLPGVLTKTHGEKLWWKATDDDKIKKYRYYLNGKKYKTKDDFFYIPQDLPSGRHLLQVRAYDRAGNKERKYVILFIR